jgi:hypothetical protein
VAKLTDEQIFTKPAKPLEYRVPEPEQLIAQGWSMVVDDEDADFQGRCYCPAAHILYWVSDLDSEDIDKFMDDGPDSYSMWTKLGWEGGEEDHFKNPAIGWQFPEWDADKHRVDAHGAPCHVQDTVLQDRQRRYEHCLAAARNLDMLSINDLPYAVDSAAGVYSAARVEIPQELLRAFFDSACKGMGIEVVPRETHERSNNKVGRIVCDLEESYDSLHGIDR